MPAELIDDTVGPSAGGHAPARSWWRDVVIVLAGFAVAGVACGLVWQWWWSPPSGVALNHAWFPDADGMDDTFTGTATYIVVALVAGVVLGGVSAWFFDRFELVTLAAVVVGSVLAAWLMYEVGTALAPPDPTAAARTAKDYTAIRGTLTVTGSGAFGSLPGGAVLGVAIVYLGVTPTRRSRR